MYRFSCLFLTLLLFPGCPEPVSPGPDGDADSDVDADGDGDVDGDGDSDADQQGDGDADGDVFGIHSVLPRRGPLAGDTVVTISGAGFVQNLTVTFGGVAATDVEVLTDREIVCHTPAQSEPGAVDVVVEIPGGEEVTLGGGFTYEPEPTTTIDSCQLQQPETIVLEAGEATPTIFGLVYAEDATEASGQAPSIRGEVGFGPDGSQPGATWTWTVMSYESDSDDNDRYSGTLLADVEGSYDYAVRFSADSGASWTLCDLDGSSAGGYTSDQAGQLTVTMTEIPRVDWCRLENGEPIAVDSGVTTPEIVGAVLEPGVTEAEGQGAGIRGQVGYGPDGANPTGGDFRWLEAAYRGDVGDNDEYAATLTLDAPSEYDVAYRFTLDGGASWVYCDTTGTNDGYSPDDAGALTVSIPSSPEVDWCNLQWPESTTSEPGGTTAEIFGQVFEPGVTDRAGMGPAMAAQLGYGPDGSDPDGSEEWSWVDAEYNVDFGYNDEYGATLTVAAAGTYDYAYRFTLDGSTWRYCDATGSSDGYDPADAGSLEVADAGPELPEWCGLWWPDATETFAGVPTGLIYGQVFEPGVTEAEGAGEGIAAELGFGIDGTDPAESLDWTWVSAQYNADNHNNDEYMATIVPPEAGTFDYAYRFSVDEGTTWLYCDIDRGSRDGYSVDTAGELTVNEADTVDWCRLQHPDSLDLSVNEESALVYGRVFEPGITDAQGQGEGVLAAVGYGPDGTDPSTAGWTWVEAAFNRDDGDNNDEYEAALTVAEPATYDYAYRFSLDEGLTWVYCDRDGSNNGYSAEQAGEMTVSQ